jgi:hypothetical protein
MLPDTIERCDQQPMVKRGKLLRLLLNPVHPDASVVGTIVCSCSDSYEQHPISCLYSCHFEDSLTGSAEWARVKKNIVNRSPRFVNPPIPVIIHMLIYLSCSLPSAGDVNVSTISQQATKHSTGFKAVSNMLRRIIMSLPLME